MGAVLCQAFTSRDLLTQFAQQANMDIPGETIMKFSVAIYENYRPNPYHNFYHALNVAQVRQLYANCPKTAVTRPDVRGLTSWNFIFFCCSEAFPCSLSWQVCDLLLRCCACCWHSRMSQHSSHRSTIWCCRLRPLDMILGIQVLITSS